MNKKIFMIGWEYPPQITGGLGIACQGLAFALARQGANVKFMVPRLYGNEKTIPGVEIFGVKEKKSLLSQKEISWLETLDREILKKEAPKQISAYAQYGMAPELESREMQNLSSEEKLARQESSELRGGYTAEIFSEIHRYAAWASVIAKKLDFDIIHAHDWMTFPAGIAAAKATGKPLVCHIHATEFDRSGETVNQRIYDLEREAMHFCSRIFAVSDLTRTIIINRYGVEPEKVRTVHNGIDYDFNNTDFSEIRKNRPVIPEGKIVLFLGRITFQKGPDYFVRAAKQVIDKIKDVKFVMAGTGDMYHRMIELAAEMGIGRHFHYTGFVNKDQVSRLLSLADLYVMPSVSEPFGIVSLEAMLHEVPVIMSKQSGVSEVINNSIKVNFWDVDEMANKIIHVLEHAPLHEELRKEAKKEAFSISWEKAAEKTKHVYEEVLAR